MHQALKKHNQIKNTEQAPKETKACKTFPQNQEFACSGNNEHI